MKGFNIEFKGIAINDAFMNIESLICKSSINDKDPTKKHFTLSDFQKLKKKFV